MAAYVPDPDNRPGPPAEVIVGAVIFAMRACVLIGGPALIILALFVLFGPQPLPPA